MRGKGKDARLVSVCPERDAERARETEIGELEVVVPVDQQVLRFEVAMEDAVRVAVEETRGELMREFL